MDRQDIFGKAPLAVAKLAKNAGVPCIAVVASTGRDYAIVYDHGIDAVIGTINRPMSMDRAVAECARLIAAATMRACRLLTVGVELGVSDRPASACEANPDFVHSEDSSVRLRLRD